MFMQNPLILFFQDIISFIYFVNKIKMYITISQSIENLVNKPKKFPFYSKILVYKPLAIKSILSNTVNFLDKKWNLTLAFNNVINIYCKRLDSLDWPFTLT